MNNRELLQQALDALRIASNAYLLPVAEQHYVLAAINDIEAALAQPEQEPVAWAIAFYKDRPSLFYTKEKSCDQILTGCGRDATKTALYTSPPIVSLSDDESVSIAKQALGDDSPRIDVLSTALNIVKATQSALLKKAEQS
jgi:hypothetical protein